MKSNISGKNINRKICSILLICFLLSSCYKKQENIHNPFYVKAQNYYTEGKYTEAIDYFNRYLKLFPDSPKANYDLASIYLEQENYIMAIFHFKKYLELEPESPDKPIIEKWINASEASLYEKLGKEYSDADTLPKETSPSLDPKLEEEIQTLKNQNEQMKKFILKHKNVLLKNTDSKSNLNQSIPIKPEPEKHQQLKIVSTSTDNDTEEFPQVEQKTQTKNYEVKSGDTLYKISSREYGSSKYYNFLWQSNKDKLKSPSALKPGDILIIPPKPED